MSIRAISSITRGRALAFIDFDYACAGNPLNDLGYAVFMFGFANKLDPFREEAGLITVRGVALIRAYFEAQSQSFDQERVTEAEAEALLPYCAWPPCILLYGLLLKQRNKTTRLEILMSGLLYFLSII